jgi:translation initiation factor 1
MTKAQTSQPTNGTENSWFNPFAALSSTGLPPAPAGATVTLPAPPRNRGRVEIVRQKAHRGGKTVTVLTGFTGLSQAEKEVLARTLQKACGTGGTCKDGRIELQGDQRAEAARHLTEAGFRPVFAGG